VQESLIHGGIANDVGVGIDWLSSDLFTDAPRAREILAEYDGLLVPAASAVRGVEGMVEAIRTARETGLPFFGICLGMQTAIIEFARNVCGISDSHSSEFAPECANAVISLMESQQHVTDMGGTMRLGAYLCRLQPGSHARAAPTASRRSASGTATATRCPTASATPSSATAALSGLSPDGSLVEIVEIADHPWFVGCQFHPELRSRPTRAHPLFEGFIARRRRAAPRRATGAANGAARLRGRSPAARGRA
jgi:CTP synthase